MKKVAIVTVNYNTAEDTKNFLKSLEKIIVAKDVQLEKIIIDNGSKEPLLPEHKEGVRYVRLSENTGFTGGYNTGIKKALDSDADYVLLINNDTLVAPDMITKLIAPFEKDSKVGLTVPKIYFARGHEFHKDRYTKEERGRVLWYAGGSMDWDHVQSIHRGVDEVDHGQYDKEKRIMFATGCCMMIKRDVLENVGFFDERYFLYYEDADLSKRILNAGYEIRYVPTAKLWHVNAASSGSGSDLHDYFLTRNQMLFGMHYAPMRAKLALFRQSIRFLLHGREFQKRGIRDFYGGKFGKGTYFD